MDVEALLAGLSDSEDEPEDLISRARLLLEVPTTGLDQVSEIDLLVQALTDQIKQALGDEISRLVDQKIIWRVGQLLSGDSTKFHDKKTFAKIEEAVGKQTAMGLRLLSGSSATSESLVSQHWDHDEQCALVGELLSKRAQLVENLADSIEELAPNMLKLVSASTCVHLLGSVGPLKVLAATPASNIQQRLKGCTSDPVFTGVPEQHMRSAQRIVAGKLVLAARVDLSKSDPQCVQGQKWRLYIQERLDKLGQAPPNKTARALPVPEEEHSKRRGGKRVRKQREKYAVTAAQRQASRVAFGDTQLKAERVTKGPSQLAMSRKMRETLKKI